jgi:hypothetical protein
MKPWNRLGLRPAIGLLIDQEQVAMSVTARTRKGRREVAHEVLACDDQSRDDVLRRMLEPWVPAAGVKRSQAKPWVRVGLPATRVFQATLPLTVSNRQYTAQNFFLEAVQATNIRAEDRIVELIKLDVDKCSVACVAASPRSIIESTIEMLNKMGARVSLIEAAPAALNRAGAYYQKAPRGAKLCCRIFLGELQAIGVLAWGAQPLFWHTFDLPKGEETAAIMAAYSTLWIMGRDARITVPIDALIIHGRPELTLTKQSAEFSARTGARLIRCDQPNNDSVAAALGSALANPQADAIAPDMARTLKPPVAIGDIFPYGEIVVHSILLGAVSLFLIGAAAEANHRSSAVEGALKAFPWMSGQNQAKLDAEKKAIQERLKAVNMFRDSRVNWSGSLRRIAAAMPQSTIITTLSGDAEIEEGSRSAASKAKKKLVINFETPLAGNEALPQQIDGFLASLRGDVTLKRHFPLVEVTGFRSNPARQGVDPSATFSVVCLPGSEKAKKPPGR